MKPVEQKERYSYIYRLSVQFLGKERKLKLSYVCKCIFTAPARSVFLLLNKEIRSLSKYIYIYIYKPNG